MVKKEDFNEMMQRKNRGYSVAQAIETAEKQKSEYNSIFIVAVTNEGKIDIMYSTDSDAEMIGVIEIAKREFMNL